MDWTGGHRKFSSNAGSQNLLLKSAQKRSYSVIRYCIMAESVKDILKQQEFGTPIASENSFKAQNIEPFCGSTGKPVEFAWKIHVGKTTTKNIECIKIMLGEEGIQPSQFQDRIIFMSICNDVVHWENTTKNVHCDTAQRVAQFAENL